MPPSPPNPWKPLVSFNLNPFQERAVVASGHCTVLACPGSGKTRVLSERAGRLLSTTEKGRLCAVTFTKDSARELRQRIIDTCGKENAPRLAVGTFHSIALDQIKRFSGRKTPRILNDGERMAVLRRCAAQHAPGLPLATILAAIENAKARVDPPPFSDPDLEDVFHAYQEIMASEGAMDFADILLTVVHQIRAGTMPVYPVRWLLVDEAQDMDAVQKEWILQHGLSGIEVTLVGDDDQSLYSFRHALGYTGLKDVTAALSATETTLPVNYRCAPNILAHAAKLIAHNESRAPKRISAFKEEPGTVLIVRAADRFDEMAKMASYIRDSGPDQKWYVLSRTNIILDAAEIALNGADLRVLRNGSKSVWDHSIGAIFIGLLQASASGSWTGVANTLSFCGVRAGEVNDHSRRTTTHRNCFDRLDAAITHAKESGVETKTLTKLRMGLAAWAEQIEKGRPALVVHGVAKFLSAHCPDKHKSLLDSLEASLARMKGSLAQRLATLARANEHEQEVEGNPVQLMTMHASKGLECDNVWIFGCEEGNIPHTDSSEADERRLFYVGLTRARARMIVSSASDEGIESRFLAEAGLVLQKQSANVTA